MTDNVTPENWLPAGAQGKISRELVHVERAIGDLRRGLAVLVTSPGSRTMMLVVAAELARAESIEALKKYGEVALALTANRAAVIHIAPMTAGGVLLKFQDDMDSGTVHALADPSQDLEKPMMGPFRHSNLKMGPSATAALQLCKHAQLLPAALVVEVPCVEQSVQQWTNACDLLSVTVPEIENYGPNSALALTQVVGAKVPLAGAEKARVIAFRPENGGLEHLAIVIGDPPRHQPVLARIHSECFTGDLIGSLKCDCGEQLRGAITAIDQAGGGVLLYLAQEGRGIGLMNKLRAYRLQDQGYDTVDANERLGFDADERFFMPAARMLLGLGFKSVRLMTNNPDKVAGLEDCGVSVVERVEHKFPSNAHNEYYLLTKKKRSGHYL